MMQLLTCSRIFSNCFFQSKHFLPRSKGFHDQKYDVAIIGGGILGLATAQELIKRNLNLKYVVLEKEDTLAQHQTGHNSGVIHTGIYYVPGSLKAELCVEGLNLLYNYCDEYSIPYKRNGKLIVAVSKDEVPRLKALFERGKQNNVSGLSMLTGDEIKQIEPHCQGVAALHSPNTGIVDYGLVSQMYGKQFQNRGGVIVNNYEVMNIKHTGLGMDTKDFGYPAQIESKERPPVNCRYIITCGGLYSDRLAMMTGCSKEPKVVPFRGDYLILRKERCNIIHGNIYPVPDPQFPFLGVHFTPRMDGSVWLGPNAILAFKREGYRFMDFSLKDSVDALSYRGLRKLLQKHWSYAIKELYDGFYLTKTVEKLQKLIPELNKNDVIRGPSGVRAQALDRDGNLVDDFVFDYGCDDLANRCLHVRNAPSPAATSSLSIAIMITDKFQEMTKT